MATATSYTQAQIDSMYAAQASQIAANAAATIDSAGTDSNGHLILTRVDDSTIDAGVVGGPTGSIIMYGGLTAPPGWLLCDGTAVSRTTYATLFALVGTRFGAGNGTTTFNVPNLQQRFPRMDSGNVGLNGGSATHSHTHNHDHNLDGGSIQAHARVVFNATGAPNFVERRISAPSWTGTLHSDTTPSGADSSTNTNGTEVGGMTATDSTATGTADNTAAGPPYLNLNFIIKV